MHVSKDKTGLYGLMAEFDSAQTIVDASMKAVAAGYTKLEAYTPIPIEELNDIIHKKRTNLPKAVLFGGLRRHDDRLHPAGTGRRSSSTRSTSAAARWPPGRRSSCRPTS